MNHRKRPTDASILAGYERDMQRAVPFIRNNPGLPTENLPRFIRNQIKILQNRGQVEFRDGGWYVRGVN